MSSSSSSTDDGDVVDVGGNDDDRDDAPFESLDASLFDVSAGSVFEAFAAAWLQQRHAHGQNGATDNNGQSSTGAAAGGGLKRVRSLELLVSNVRQRSAGLRSRLSTELTKRREAIEARLKTPPFVRQIDMVSFVANVCLIPVTQYFLLVDAANFYVLYTGIIVPLLLQRYFHYHALKWHYFLLDFCYMCQLLVLYYCYWRTDSALFQMLFLLCNGPLTFAVVMWKNSIVFHDWDKMFSFIIHFHPSLVTYTIRWHTAAGQAPAQAMSLHTLAGAMVLYSFWQAMYLIKTELLDRKKLNSDEQLLTSLRWLAFKKPHPIYKRIKKMGYDPNPLLLLVVFQFFYSALIALPMMLAYHYRAVHQVYLMGVFLVAVVNGAQFYFEVFTESYTKRLAEAEKGAQKPGSHRTSWYSFAVFLGFLAVALPALFYAIEFAIGIAS
jgi:hypothetical protein